MPKKNTYNGSRKVKKSKVSKKTSKKSNKNISKKLSKKSTNSKKKNKSYKNVTTSSEDMREILNMSDNVKNTPKQITPNQQMQGMPMTHIDSNAK